MKIVASLAHNTRQKGNTSHFITMQSNLKVKCNVKFILDKVSKPQYEKRSQRILMKIRTDASKIFLDIENRRCDFFINFFVFFSY